MGELEFVEMVDVCYAEVERGEKYKVEFTGRWIGLGENGQGQKK